MKPRTFYHLSGLYIHIPFCKRACHYCDFHFSTSTKYKAEVLNSIIRELEIRRDYLNSTPLESIYIGGGTPSLLSTSEICHLFETISKDYSLAPFAEITLEANPEDLTKQKIEELKKTTPINRLSIGIQSFYDEDLKWMNRIHSTKESIYAIKKAQDVGFKNLTIDLIYGFPLLNNNKLKSNLEQSIELEIPHISAYCITVEPKTALDTFIQKNKTPAMDDEQGAEQFEILMEILLEKGYEQYEISNFSLPDFNAVHNSNYWKQKSYLGVGPSAHSFNLDSRQWNISNNIKYIEAIQHNMPYFEIEYLDPKMKFNEYVMTSLRTKWGIDKNHLKNSFEDQHVAHLFNQINIFKKQNWIEESDEFIILSKKGKLFADHISSELFI